MFCYVTFCYVWITFVVSFLQILLLDYMFGYVSCNGCVKTHNTLQMTKTKDLQDCGVSTQTLCPEAFWPSGPQQGSPLRLVTFEIRFYYVWEHPSNSWQKRPCQVRYRSVAGSLKPFGMRLGYVSRNSIATEQFESTNLYVCIRLVQPFHRFVSGPLRLVTFVYV